MVKIYSDYNKDADIILYNGDCLNLLKQIPDNSVQLVVTSPPYNLGMEYEKKISFDEYLNFQTKVIKECVRILKLTGSICWQIGNYKANNKYYPLDIYLHPIFIKSGLIFKNRIIWHFKAGLGSNKRFYKQYETVMWYVKSNNYTFNLDPLRVTRIYPRKKFKCGIKKGQPKGHPLGKNPGDVWHITRVHNTHIEKTQHPCQYPIGLVERLILALTDKGDIVVDPFLGSGATAAASILHNRRCFGADNMKKYIEIAKNKIKQAINGTLKYKSYINSAIKTNDKL